MAAAVAAALRALSATAPEDRPAPDVQIALEQRQIVGAYELPDATVPVFDHQYEPLREHLLLRGGPLSWPDDAPPPPVAAEHLVRLEQHVAEHGAPPPFHPVARSLAPIDVARTLSDDTPRTYAERQTVIAAAYEDPLARIVYPTLRHFAEAVEHWQRQLTRPRVPEAPLPEIPGRPPLPRRPRPQPRTRFGARACAARPNCSPRRDGTGSRARTSAGRTGSRSPISGCGGSATPRASTAS